MVKLNRSFVGLRKSLVSALSLSALPLLMLWHGYTIGEAWGIWASWTCATLFGLLAISELLRPALPIRNRFRVDILSSNDGFFTEVDSPLDALVKVAKLLDEDNSWKQTGPVGLYDHGRLCGVLDPSNKQT